MTEDRRREILAFERKNEDLSPEAFFAKAEAHGYTIQDFRDAEEEPEE
jgi:hypothetical protein